MSTSIRSEHGTGWIRAVVAVAVVSFAMACAARQPIVERDDASISNDVRARLAADSHAHPLGVTVDTKAGVVMLTGAVPTDDDRNAVERIARETPGVRTVDNDVVFGLGAAPIVR